MLVVRMRRLEFRVLGMRLGVIPAELLVPVPDLVAIAVNDNRQTIERVGSVREPTFVTSADYLLVASRATATQLLFLDK